MKNDEIIIVKPDETIYIEIVKSAIKYAILSLAFTIDRMRLIDQSQRILNIAKGKIAEKLFAYFCIENNIKADFKTCETPFYQIDKRDFILDNFEWDIKNNFIYHSGNILEKYKYTDLPALIPNRHNNDQWEKRKINIFEKTDGVKFLFTFMQGAKLDENRERTKYFLSLNLNNEQNMLLKKLYSKYKGLPTEEQPFEPNKLWIKINEIKDADLFTLNFFPSLIITGYSDLEQELIFKNTGPNEKNNFQDYISPSWYKKTGRNNSINFLNNTLWTKITNATIPVSKMNSFKKNYEL